MQIPRPEYPNPIKERSNWLNLNGEWDFAFDENQVGEAKRYFERESLDRKITVPFCPESILSGIGDTDYHNCVWYHRGFVLPKSFEGKRTLLNFGAVDWHAKVWVNSTYVGEHKGGYTAFCFDITDFLCEGENSVCLCAYDDIKSFTQPAGKQSFEYASRGCSYTRTTGIWQTVWLEAAGQNYIENILISPNISRCSANLTVKIARDPHEQPVRVLAYYGGRVVGSAECEANSASVQLELSLSEKHLWELGRGELYDLEVSVGDDTVKSYFGLREVCLSQGRFMLNGKSVFSRLVLDQGFYPDGIYTAPDDEALKNDIIYSMQLGFNGARFHEKIFEPRSLYWADKLGYMTWAEYPDWVLDISRPENIYSMLPEWIERVERDFSHPSVVGWCPFNETWDREGRKQYDGFILTLYEVTKALDPSRPVIDTSGNYHLKTDIYDIHDYEYDEEKYKERYAKGPYNNYENRQKYNGEPYFVSEYGGIGWSLSDNAWGYGRNVQSEEEFIKRYKGLTETLLSAPYMLGFCYTQLTDVEQEQNGLMSYDRRFKFDPELIRAINSQKAAIEE